MRHSEEDPAETKIITEETCLCRLMHVSHIVPACRKTYSMSPSESVWICVITKCLCLLCLDDCCQTVSFYHCSADHLQPEHTHIYLSVFQAYSVTVHSLLMLVKCTLLMLDITRVSLLRLLGFLVPSSAITEL